MQKSNKKASILLWAIMLSLIVAISFIAISSKITKNIKLSGKLNEYFEIEKNIDSALVKRQNTLLSENSTLIFDNSKEHIFSFKKGEEQILTFSGSSDFNIDLGVIQGGGVLYEYNFDGSSTESGVLNYSVSFSGSLDSSDKLGTLILKNLGGYSQILIKSETGFETNTKKYKIVQNIGNYSLIHTRGNLK